MGPLWGLHATTPVSWKSVLNIEFWGNTVPKVFLKESLFLRFMLNNAQIKNPPCRMQDGLLDIGGGVAVVFERLFPHFRDRSA